MLDAGNSDLTAIQPDPLHTDPGDIDLNHYGIDPDGPDPPNSEADNITLNTPTIPLTNEQFLNFQANHNPLAQSANYGSDLFQSALEHVLQFQQLS
jgi:hypothetical protein